MHNLPFPFSQLMSNHTAPTVMVFVGPNGSGKSSVINHLGIVNVYLNDNRYNGRMSIDQDTGESFILLINPDDIAKKIRMENPAYSWDECNFEAAKRANLLREMLAQAEFDFAFETVGSHPSKIEFLEKLKKIGYNIIIVFVSTSDVEINIERVKQRNLSGGHDVPEHKIVGRYNRTMSLLSRYYDVADYMVILDNSKFHECGDGEGPELLLVKRLNDTFITDEGYNSTWLKERLPYVYSNDNNW